MEAIYTSDYSRNTIFNQEVTYEGSQIVTAYVSATFTPASGISAVQLSDVDLIGENIGSWSSIGTDIGALPVYLLNDGSGSSQIIYVSATYTNPSYAATQVDDGLGFQFSFAVAELSAGSVDTLGLPGSATATEAWPYVGSLTGAGGQITYDATPTFNLNQSVAYGTSATQTGSFTFTSSSLEGDNTSVSAVSFDVYLSGSDTSKFSTISGSVTIPGTVTVGNTINISTIVNNDYLHASADLYTVVAVVSTSNPQLSASWIGAYTPAVTNFTTAEMTLTALGDAGAPSGVTVFVADPGQERVGLSWVNPTDADLSAVRVNFAWGTAAPASETAGVFLYEGTGTSTEHLSLTAGSAFAYSIFSVDNVGNWSSLTADTSATATPFAASQYGLGAKWPYLTDAEIRRKLLEEGII